MQGKAWLSAVLVVVPLTLPAQPSQPERLSRPGSSGQPRELEPLSPEFLDFLGELGDDDREGVMLDAWLPEDKDDRPHPGEAGVHSDD
jgi:hypothetical protein